MSTVIEFGAPGAFGFRITGALGKVNVSDAGDVNGDGVDDLIVSEADGTHVIFGSAAGLGAIDLDNLAASAGFSLADAVGEAAPAFAVSSAGDVNNDGFADLILGFSYFNTGRAYVVFGKAGGFEGLNLGNLAPADGFVINGDTADDETGASVSSAGDVNGDGFDDVIVGAPGGDDGGNFAGEAYVIFGKAGGFGAVDLGALPASAGFKIQGDLGDSAGSSVSGAGDVNGDGFDDLIVGAPFREKYGEIPISQDRLLGGEAYVIYGKAGGFAAIDLTNLAAADGISLRAEFPYDLTGVSVSSAGDVNGDGVDDMLVGATMVGSFSGEYYGDVPDGPGKAYVVFGRTDGLSNIDLGSLTPDQGFVIRGDIEEDEAAGISVSSAGDINGDGFDDILVGAPTSYYNPDSSPGRAYVIYGKAGGFGPIELGDLSPEDGFIVRGIEPGDRVGTSVSSAGDLNGDGFADIIIGSGWAVPVPSDVVSHGAVVIYGGNNRFDRANYVPRHLVGSGAANVLEGNLGDDLLEGGGGNDLLLGWLGDDHLDGGAGIDTASYANADLGVGVSLDLADPQDTVGAGIDTLVRIENLIGSAFADRLAGNSGNNVLDGGAGDDKLRGNGGADTLIGGSGIDLAVYADSVRGVTVRLDVTAAQNTVGAGTDTLTGIEGLLGSDFADRLTGNAGANQLNGGLGHDRLAGGDGADSLQGSNGNDVLDGGAGGDTARGGAGNDIYHVDRASDRAIEDAAAGTDAVYSSVSFTLGANIERLVLTGSAAQGTGNGLANEVIGNAAANRLAGGGGNDTLSGAGGNDLLYGGAGLDSLTGGAGADRFYFDAPLNASTNVDRIRDFAAADDSIYLDRSVFTGISADGLLSAAAFRAGTRAADADDRIVYNSATGILYYDADGSGAGAQVAFARVTAGTSLTRADFTAYSPAGTAPAAGARAPLFEEADGPAPDLGLLHPLPHPQFGLDGPALHIV